MQISPFFTPVHSLLGGFMLSASVHTLLSQLGTVLGISGFFHGTISSFLGRRLKTVPESNSKVDTKVKSDATSGSTARLFTLGLVSGGLLLGTFRSSIERQLGVRIFDASTNISAVQLVFWGALVGLGTKLGSGCTSGHFLCGLSRLSPRSIAATATFFSVAVVTHLATTTPIKSASFIQAAATAEVIRSPQPLMLALFQIPALLYAIFVPSLTLKRQQDSSETTAQKHALGARVTSFATGLHFALGLAMTGMLRPSKVLGFLALSPQRISSGEWDPSLACVAIGGIIPAAIGYFASIKPKVERAKQVQSPKAEDQPSLNLASPLWRLPTSQVIDGKLLGGAAMFGVGWGLSGLCPGPVVANLGAGLSTGQNLSQLATFCGSMAIAGQAVSLMT